MSVLATAPVGLSKQRICAALGERRHRCYVDTRSRPQRQPVRPQPRQLTSEQRADVLGVLHAPEFCDASPRQVHAQLLSTGQVLASVSTFYRLLRAQNEVTPRRLQRPPQTHNRPQLMASAPNQVWTWDITKLPSVVRGAYLNLYLILDLYSRFVVGWMISRKENAGLAKHLFKRVLNAHAVPENTLTVHQDRGSPMTAHTFAELLSSLGVERSHSRPRTSNDNAFSESQFKTLKYAGTPRTIRAASRTPTMRALGHGASCSTTTTTGRTRASHCSRRPTCSWARSTRSTASDNRPWTRITHSIPSATFRDAPRPHGHRPKSGSILTLPCRRSSFSRLPAR
jgi:transposase InsO family protein